MSGYRPKPRSRVVTFDTFEVEEGAEPFTATIRSHLTFGEIELIPLDDGTPWTEIEAVIAPWVLAWNVQAMNAETGEYEPVPAPAVGGVEMFHFVSGIEVQWLAMVLKQPSTGEVAESDLKKSEPTPASSDSETSP